MMRTKGIMSLLALKGSLRRLGQEGRNGEDGRLMDEGDNKGVVWHGMGTRIRDECKEDTMIRGG